jgi:DNA-binding response OmpR family regulator
MTSWFSRKPRVLVLDDDLSMQKLVSALLRRDGYRVDTVNSGRKAIEAIAKTNYGAVLLDLMMPTEGGMTVIRHLREKNPELLKRVIILTATPESVVKKMASDVFAIVQKPFQAEDLSAAVKRLG